MSIRSRISIPGGTCEFDLPAYYAWQKLEPARRRADLLHWVSSLMPLAEALQVLLGLLRDSGVPHKVVAPAGQYQQSLPQGRVYQLMRVRLDAERTAGARDQRPPADGVGAADAPGRRRPAQAEPGRHELRVDLVFLSMASITAACHSLPGLRRPERVRQHERLPPVLQRALQEPRLRRLGERCLCRRCRHAAERPVGRR